MSSNDDVVTVDWNKRARESIDQQQGDDKPEDVECIEIVDSIKDLTLLEKFTNLASLSIFQPAAAPLSLRSIDKLPKFAKLLSLELPDHMLSELPEDVAVRYPSLVRADFSNNKFYSTAKFAALSACPHLTELDVADNPFVKSLAKDEIDYRAELRALLPQLKVIDGMDNDGNIVEEDDDDDEEEDEELDMNIESAEEEDEEDEEGCEEDADTRKRSAADTAVGEPEAKRLKTE